MSQKPLSIGCITSSVSYHGGWDTLSKGIIGAVAKKHSVIALTASDAENDAVSYVVHKVLPKQYISYSLLTQIGVFISTVRYLRKCDALHVFVEPYAPGAALAAKLLRKPLIITIAGTYCVIPSGSSLRERLKRMLMKFMYKQACLVATGSHQNIERIEQVQPLNDKWKFIPFGVDPEKFKSTKEYPKPQKPFILTVGAVKPRKGALYTIKALNLLKDEFPNLEYYIGGSYVENPYTESIQNAIKEYGLEERVKLLGRIEDEKLLELYSTCSAFVLAAQTIDGAFEGFPMVFYEAHSLGAPVVSTHGFGSEYVIKNGHNGFLVPQDDHVALADAIRKIVGDDILRESMSKNARVEASEHTWDKIALHYLDAYTSCVSK